MLRQTLKIKMKQLNIGINKKISNGDFKKTDKNHHRKIKIKRDSFIIQISKLRFKMVFFIQLQIMTHITLLNLTQVQEGMKDMDLGLEVILLQESPLLEKFQL